MINLYYNGYQDALEKIGIDRSTMSTGDRRQPLETGDDQLPAGQLAAMLGGIGDGGAALATKSQGDGGQHVEERLNRDTTWDNSVEIPSHYMLGSTTGIPGGGL